MSSINEQLRLANVAYDYAVEHYGDRDARFDVIVECMDKREIAAEFAASEVTTDEQAIAWAREIAGLQREQQLNQAWDGPESIEPGYEF